MLSNREEFIKQIFIPKQKKEGMIYPSDKEVGDIIKQISKIGESIGYIGTNISKDQAKNDKRKHKYDVWIAKEVKREESILKRITDIRLIIDWACDNKVDLFSYTFQKAFEQQASWHLEMLTKYEIEEIAIPDIDKDRIVFRFSDKKHFLYLISSEELKFEGQIMGHCVGGSNYVQKLKNNMSLILSIRDEKNKPHVTIEIDVSSRMVVQQQGRGNSNPIQKYKNFIREFLLFSTDFNMFENKEVLKFLNLDFITNT